MGEMGREAPGGILAGRLTGVVNTEARPSVEAFSRGRAPAHGGPGRDSVIRVVSLSVVQGDHT